MEKTAIRIMISNLSALLVFYLMYRWGAANIPEVQQFYQIPLAFVIGYLIISDVKEIKSVQNL